MFESLKISNRFKEQIELDINKGRLSHAVILEGGDEATRFAVATELAQAILCTGEHKPCGECKACRKVAHSSHPDLHVLEKDEKATMIKVDEIRELKHQAQLKPNDGDKAVFIVVEAQTMNPQAQNALLKIFEEPAPHVNFILTAPSKSAFLETIISRGAAYSLSNEADNGTTEEDENVSVLVTELTNALIDGNEYDVMCGIAKVKKDKLLFSAVNDKLSDLFRDALVNQNGITSFITNDTQLIEKLSQRKDTQTLLKYIKHTEYIRTRINANANFNLLLTEFASGFYK